MNHGLKVNGNVLEITLSDNIHIDKVIVNRQVFSQRMQVCESCKYHGLEGHEEPCVSCEVGNSNYVPSVEQEERMEERTETHACDCISRRDAINAFEPDHPVDWYTTMIVDVLENLPSAQPEQQWIPCSERLPEEDHWLGGSGRQFSDKVLVSIFNSADKDEWVDASYTIDGEWTLELPRDFKVIAWEPLPEPYMEVDE